MSDDGAGTSGDGHDGADRSDNIRGSAGDDNSAGDTGTRPGSQHRRATAHRQGVTRTAWEILAASRQAAALAEANLRTAAQVAAQIRGPLSTAQQLAMANSPVMDAARRANEQQMRLMQASPTWLLAQQAVTDKARLTALAAQVSGTSQIWPQLLKSWRSSNALHYLQSQQFRDFAHRAAEFATRYTPANWHGADVEWSAAWTIAVEEGLALVWVPRCSLVVELLAAPDADARWGILADNATDIVDDCAEVTTTVTAAPLAQYRDRLEDAIRTHRAGIATAAQALAAVVFTALIQYVYVGGKLTNLTKSPLRATDPESVQLAAFKAALLIEASIGAVAAVGDLVPTERWPAQFNRHLTLHRVANEQYTDGNAVAALMLATALLAEAQELLEAGRLTLDPAAEVPGA